MRTKTEKVVRIVALITLVVFASFAQQQEQAATPPAPSIENINVQNARTALASMDALCATTVMVKIGNEPMRGINRAEQLEMANSAILLGRALDALEALQSKERDAEAEKK